MIAVPLFNVATIRISMVPKLGPIHTPTRARGKLESFLMPAIAAHVTYAHDETVGVLTILNEAR